MSGDTSNTYAPKSPDLSSFLSGASRNDPTTHHEQWRQHQPQYEDQHHHQHPHQPPHPQQHHRPPPYYMQAPPPSSLDKGDFDQAQRLHQQTQKFHQGFQHPYQPSSTGYDYTPSFAPPGKADYSTYGSPTGGHIVAATSHQPFFDPNLQPLPPQLYEHPNNNYYPPAPISQPYAQPHAPPHHSVADPSYEPVSHSAAPPIKDEPSEHHTMPPRRTAAPVEEPPRPEMEPSPVKTKFPTARIKRIMQADEEVGKVAQQTPIAVGKALELFMVQLVRKSAEIAKDKGSKRVTASMLKEVVETDEHWDFLREIVGKVENEKENGKQKPKQETDSDEEDAYEPKKKARGRKKRGV